MSALRTFVSPAELQQLLAADAASVLLDVRTSAEFGEVHIPQARSAPLNQLKPKALLEAELLFRNQPVYLVCRTDVRAIIAAAEFAAAGYGRTYIVKGGLLAWVAAGLPVVRSPAQTISLERQGRIVAGSLILTGVVLGGLVHPAFIGLSVFFGAGLIFSGLANLGGLELLLARLPWNQRS